MDAVTLATLITTLGGIATLVLNSLIKNKSSRQDELLKFRSELQAKLEIREATIDKMRQDYDALQERFYTRDRECAKVEVDSARQGRDIAQLERQLAQCQAMLSQCEDRLRGKGG